MLSYLLYEEQPKGRLQQVVFSFYMIYSMQVLLLGLCMQ